MPASSPAASLAPITRERLGLNRKVGRIVPKRYSLVTSMIPASAENTPARLPTPSWPRWSSALVEARRLGEQPGQQREEHDERDHPEHEPDRGARRADLQQLRVDLRDHARGSEVSSRKTSSSEEPSATSSWIGTPAAKAMSPTRSLVVPWTRSA